MRSRTPTSIFLLTSLAAAVTTALIACTTETNLISRPAPEAEAGDVPDEQVKEPDASKPPQVPDGLAFGATCKRTSECRTGLLCNVYTGATRGYCAAQCGAGNGCPKAEGACINLGVCAPSCDTGCPAETDCYTGRCIPKCKDRVDICGPNASCDVTDHVSICFADTPPDPPIDKCMSPTTTVTSGVSTAKTIAATTAAEKGTLCDWQNGRLGGYGCTTKCDGGVSLTNKADQATCKATMKPTCTVTVAQFEACVTAIAGNRCDLTGALAGACKPLIDTPGCR